MAKTKTALRQAATGKRREQAKPSRKLNFQNEPWYAMAAQRMSAARSAQRLPEAASPPLAAE